MMDITSKHRHRRRTTGGGKRWRKRNAHTERHESKSGMDTSMRNVRGASRGKTGTDSERGSRMKQKKEAEVLKNRQLLSMAIELAEQSERLVLLNEVGCVEDVIQVAEQLCGKLGNLIAFAKDIQRGAKQHDLEGMHEEKETVHGA